MNPHHQIKQIKFMISEAQNQKNLSTDKTYAIEPMPINNKLKGTSRCHINCELDECTIYAHTVYGAPAPGTDFQPTNLSHIIFK